MKKKLQLTFMVMLMGLIAHAQLSGNYTIPGTTYPTIKSAIAAVNAQGVGPEGVVFNVTAGYTETFATSQDGIFTTTTSSAANPIIFQKSGTGPNPVVTAGTGSSTGTPMDAVFAFGGTDYVTFDGINIQENPANTTSATEMETGFWLAKASATDGTQHITIKNSKMSGFKKSYIIASTAQLLSGAAALPTSFTGTNSYNKFYSDSLVNTTALSQSVYLYGPSNASTTGFYDYGNEIGVAGGNTFLNTVYINTQYNQWLKIANNQWRTSGQNITYNLIYVQTGKSVQIYNNDLGNFTISSSISNGLISDGSNLDTVNVYNNNIHDINCSTVSNFIGIQEYCSGLINKVYGNQIQNITLGSGSTTTGSFTGIYLYAAAAPTGAETDVYNNTLTGNVISNSSASNTNSFIYANWYGSYMKIYNNTITNNTTNCNGTTSLIYANCLSNIAWNKYIYGNTISNHTNNGGGTLTGIYHTNSLRTYIYGNKISNLTSTGAASLIYGIQFDGGTYGQIYNNYISELYTPASSGNKQIVGLNLTGGSSVAAHYNTIYLDASSTGTNFGTVGIYASTTPMVTLRDNLVDNVSVPSGTGLTVAFNYASTSRLNFAVASNNNNYYAGTPGASHLIYYDGTNMDQTLVAYQSRVYPAEGFSITENTNFLNVASHPYNLHINSSGSQCESAGIIINSPDSVKVDYYNTPRYPNPGYPLNPSYPPVAPDIGAEEFAGSFKVLSPPHVLLTPLQNTSSLTNRILTTTITDLTGVPTSGSGLPVLYWNKNNGSWNAVTAAYVSGNQYNFTFGGGVSLNDSVKYYIVAQDLNTSPGPNVGSTPPGATGLTINPPAAATPPPYPFAYKVVPGVCGTYTVGSGGNYPTLTAAINDINPKEITCAVTLLLTDPLYTNETFPIAIGRIAGLNPVNTLTIKPATGVNASIQGSTTSSIISFNGANYVTVDGSNNGTTSRNLTIWNSNSATLASAVYFTSPSDYSQSASNDIVKNCNIRANTQVSNTTYGILCNYSSGGGYSNLIINNNAVYAANVGIRICGTTAFPALNCQVTNNIVGTTTDSTSIQLYDIYVTVADNTLVQGNEVMGASVVGNTNNNISGIRMYTLATNTKVRRNKVHGLKINPGSGYTGPWGIFYRAEASSTTEISNNLVYDIQGVGGSTGYYALAGIAIQNGGYVNVWNNSIDLEGNCLLVSQGTSQSGCIVITSAVAHVDIRDNILKNNLQLSSGSSTTIVTYGIFCQAPLAGTFSFLNNNDYYITGVNPNIGSLTSNNVNYPTLASWQAATYQDQFSVNVDPGFTYMTNFHPTAAAVLGAGIYLPGVPTDIDGNSRTNPTDMGCYQVTNNTFTVVTTAATGVTNNAANINGTVTANNLAITTGFDYGLTTAYGTSVPGTPPTITGNTSTPMTYYLSGLLPLTTYHYRATGVSGSVTMQGADMTFTTWSNPPLVVTNAATGISGTGATLNGSVTANGVSTNVTFDYGLTTAYGTTVAGVPASVTGYTATGVSVVLTGLLPGNTYHFRVNGVNTYWSLSGLDMTFATPALAPTVITNNATNITSFTATLNGNVTANGALTTNSFEWGLTTNYGNTVAASPGTVSGNTATAISDALTGLTPYTTYHYRAKGVNSVGTTYGADVIFNTSCIAAGPAGPITGPVQTCQGGSGYVYTVAPILYALSYNWTLPPGGAITAGAGTNTITVSYGANAVSGNMVVYGVGSCGNGASSQLAVTVNAAPVPTISGPASVCINVPGKVYTTQTGMTGYTWAVTGGNITAGAGTSSITVTWNTLGTQTVSVNYTNLAGCPALAPTVYNVTVNALPTPIITGNATVCQGYTINYTTQIGQSGYIWSVSAGGQITGGQGTASVNVLWNLSGAQTVSVNYTNSNGCTAASPASYPVTVLASPIPSLTGPSTACADPGYNVNYTTDAGYTGYVWTISAGGSINSGQGTSQVQVTWNSGGAQSISVNYTNGNGCSAANATVLNVTVTSLPDAAGAITGTSAVCGGTQGVAYSCPPINGSTYTMWNLPPGAGIASGAGTNSITVNFANDASSGNITVYGTNSCGNGAQSPNFPVTVTDLPAAAGTITGYSDVCQGSSGLVYSVTPIANATDYHWTVPTGATIVSGGNTNTITVNFSMNAISGYVTVYGSNSCGNGAVSPSFQVTVNPIPPTPTITANGYVLTSSAPAGNQWYHNGNAVPGATGQTYTVPPTQGGWYWTIVDLQGCSSDTSNHIYIVGVGIGEQQAENVKIYPVPNDGNFTVSIESTSPDPFTIMVFSNLGVQIQEVRNIYVNGHIDQVISLSSAASGIYTVIIRNSSYQVVRKVIVTK